jgi:ABC-type transport system involved in Fe-S cluster assembly fused permease/ATPase subunit
LCLYFFVFVGISYVPIIIIDLCCLIYVVWDVQKEDNCRRFKQEMEASYTKYNNMLLDLSLLVPCSQIVNNLISSVAYYTDRALRVVEQTVVRSLAQLHGTETVEKV